jgi:hypothetical protein
MLIGFVVPKNLTANLATCIYNGPPDSKVGVIDVRAVNRGGAGLASISLAISKNAASALEVREWVCWDFSMAEYEEFEKTKLQVFPGEKVFARVSHPSISVRADGFERPATGISASASPQAGQIVKLFTCPANVAYVGSVLVCTRSAVASRVSIAIGGGDTVIPDQPWLTRQRTLKGYRQFEKYGFVLQPTESAFYVSDAANTSVRGQFLLGG